MMNLLKFAGIFFLLILMFGCTVSASFISVNSTQTGYLFNNTDQLFLSHRSAPGESHTKDDASYIYTDATMTATAGIFHYIHMGYIVFPTDTLPDNAIPTAATIDISRLTSTRYNAAGDPGGAEIIDFHPTEYPIVPADYMATSWTRMAENLSYASLSGSGWSTWTENADGLSHINKTGNTTIMLTFAANFYGTNMSDNATWTNGAQMGYRWRSINTGSIPRINITYTAEPTPSFTADYTGGISPLLVNFTDTTSGDPATAWLWYDNDTLFNSTQTPQFVAFTTGNHPIKLNASNAAGGTNSSVTWINVTDAPALVIPVPDFSADDTTVTWPTAVQFTDLSESNILGRNWTFGDGTNSTAANPSHVYPNVDATYTVILEVVNISGYNTTTKADYITVTSLDPPLASFTKNATIGVQPATIQFTDTSTNSPTQWNWSFGDGTWDNSTQNVTHTYTSAGVFNAFLIATNTAGSNQSANQTVTVYDSVTADFTATASGTTVTFTDTSAGTRTAWVWQYNNPATPGWTQFSTEANPAYTFTPGTYDISLNASNPVSFDSEVKTGYIVVTASGAMLTENPQNLQPQQAGSYIIIALTLVGLGFIIGGAVMIVKMLTKGTGMMNGRGGSATPDLSGDFVIGLTAITIGAIFLLVTYVILGPMFTISGV